tara:strand:+ start:210 stop:779 length:570 start_codon:yes stop_codon:yes gene_type:complete
MKTNANSLRIGNIIEHQNQLWKIIKKDHVKPGKGGAYVQLEMKEISTGTKTNIRLSSSQDAEVAFTEQKKFQFQYFDHDDIMAMDLESYETLNFNKSLAGDAARFLDDEMEITVEFCNDKPISISLPENITVKIDTADGVVKGQTASSSYKPAVLENGVKVLVPPFTQSGDEIVIKSETGEYVSRAGKK